MKRVTLQYRDRAGGLVRRRVSVSGGKRPTWDQALDEARRVVKMASDMVGHEMPEDWDK